MVSTSSTTLNMTLESVLRDVVDGVFVIDRNRHVIFFSEGCERLTGISRASAVGSQCPCYKLTECYDEYGRSLAGALCPSLRVFAGDCPSCRQRMSIRRQDGRKVWVETTYSPMKGADGEVVAAVGVMRDATETIAREQELKAAAHGLTAREGEDSETLSAAGGEQEQSAAQDDTGTAPGPLDRMLFSLERREILTALKSADGQRTRAARLLGISRSRLYRRMEALGIGPRQAGSPEPV